MFKLVMKRVFYKGHVAFALPDSPALRERLRHELARCRDRHNDYVLVTLEPPKRPRTTGARSQNHHLNGHIMQICNDTGNDYDTIKHCVKMIAVEQLGYPYATVAGHVLPQKESMCSTDECAKLIEAAHLLAAELGIVLQE
ncbi:MAG: hypothetical protein J6N15_09500 [Ruminiclostridium sp.]|nr:hypothetical protein [Ruminiclostridium sp.]